MLFLTQRAAVEKALWKNRVTLLKQPSFRREKRERGEDPLEL